MTPVIGTKTKREIEHRIPAGLLEKRVRITVVGRGGTGSAITAGLPHLHQAVLAAGHPQGLDVTLIDGDRISRTNCVRQPFSESEIGLHKSTVLATRINLFWGLGWKGLTAGIWVSRVYYDRDRLMKAWRKPVISLLRVALLNRRELGPLCTDRKDPKTPLLMLCSSLPS
jgi:hypothetical protein